MKVFQLYFVGSEGPLHLFKHTFLRILCGHILFAKVDIGEKCERQNQVRRDETERTVTRAMAMEAAEGGSY